MIIFGGSIGGALVAAVVYYVLTFVVVYVAALIADALAPTFGAQKNQPNALKLVVYSMTPAWVAGVFSLIPHLAILILLGWLYGLYLLWLGVPALMKAPDEKSVPYTAAIAVCTVVINVVVGWLVGQVFHVIV
jgi:hypothetical protein